MLMDFFNELFVDVFEFLVEFGYFVVEFGEGLLVGEPLVEVSDGVEVGVLKILIWHILLQI